MTFPTTHPALARALAARDYSTPTPVQAAVLEAEALGRDLLVSAQTGSGKTVAFGLAMAARLLPAEERLPPATAPMALIIAPTRELAMQVQRELAWLYAETGARVVTCVGGMDPRAEARQLGFGAHIVVGTPGRLRDHLERKRLDLASLRTVVLDEADEMLDLGFREDLEFILEATAKDRQTLLFSATMPREIETLAKTYQQDAVRIETLRRNEQHADIEYRAIRVSPRDIENAVVNVLRFYEVRAAIVFCATREAVKRMHAHLAERGFSAVALSGELTQNERTLALQTLRDGRARVLVATDVAARGLDLPDLSLVVHAELPNDHETLLHRSGRTGRAGRKGISLLIVPYNRRRKAEALLGAAKLKVTWATPPGVDEIRARDQERFLADPTFTDPATPEEEAIARTIQGAKSAEEVALALVRLWRSRLPEPEDLPEDTGPPPRRDGFERRPDRAAGRPHPRHDRNRPEHEPSERREGPHDRGRRPPRVDGREMVWFRLNIGRERNADPRWILPLICKAGNISKADIGAIRIFDRDTRFEIAADSADLFAETVRRNKQKEGHISRVGEHVPREFDAVTKAIDALTAPEAKPGSVERNQAPREREIETRGAPLNHRREKPWRKNDRDRGADQKMSGPKPHHMKSRDGKPHEGERPPKRHQADHASPRPASPRPMSPRPTSKYAHKKKRRPEPAS